MVYLSRYGWVRLETAGRATGTASTAVERNELMIEKYSLEDCYGLFVSLCLYLPVNCVLILVISSLVVSDSPFAARLGFVTLPFLMTFIYTFDRVSISEEDRINNPYRTALVEKYRREILALGAVSLLLFELSLVIPLAQYGAVGAAYVALGHLPIAILYAYDRVKSLPLPLDSITVGFTWSFAVVYVFAFIAPGSLSGAEGLTLLVGWFLIVFAGVEARNTEDIEGDREAGKITLAVLFGKTRATWLARGLKATGGAVLAVVAGNPLVLSLVAVHVLSLSLYRIHETECRKRHAPARQNTDYT